VRKSQRIDKWNRLSYKDKLNYLSLPTAVAVGIIGVLLGTVLFRVIL